MESIYAATFITERPEIVLAYNDVIKMIYTEYPKSQLFLEIYYIKETEPEQIIIYLKEFLDKYSTERKAIIALETVFVLILYNYIKNVQLNIPIFSTYATSPIIKTLTNVLTYAPSDKYSVMSLFMKYIDYEMENIKILFNTTTSSTFVKTYVNEVKTQADYLGISVETEPVQIGKAFYGIKPKTMIIIILATSILNNLVTQEFINNIPDSCFIALTDANVNIGDIFKRIPAFVMSPYPIDYTETTSLVYNNLTDKKNYPYHVFCFYDLLYSLNFYTNISFELNTTNFIQINPFQAGVSPAFIAAQSNFNLVDNGYSFGVYQSIFTNNILVGNDEQLFTKYNKGGTLSLPNSVSIFKTLGIVPFFNVNIFYENNNYYKIYDQCGNLILTRFGSNITNFPIKQNSKINISQQVDNKFYCAYNSEGYFSFLSKTINPFEDESIVNLTMGKTPKNKVFRNE
jgi:hypothetical protein